MYSRHASFAHFTTLHSWKSFCLDYFLMPVTSTPFKLKWRFQEGCCPCQVHLPRFVQTLLFQFHHYGPDSQYHDFLGLWFRHVELESLSQAFNLYKGLLSRDYIPNLVEPNNFTDSYESLCKGCQKIIHNNDMMPVFWNCWYDCMNKKSAVCA